MPKQKAKSVEAMFPEVRKLASVITAGGFSLVRNLNRGFKKKVPWVFNMLLFLPPLSMSLLLPWN